MCEQLQSHYVGVEGLNLVEHETCQSQQFCSNYSAALPLLDYSSWIVMQRNNYVFHDTDEYLSYQRAVRTKGAEFVSKI